MSRVAAGNGTTSSLKSLQILSKPDTEVESSQHLEDAADSTASEDSVQPERETSQSHRTGIENSALRGNAFSVLSAKENSMAERKDPSHIPDDGKRKHDERKAALEAKSEERKAALEAFKANRAAKKAAATAAAQEKKAFSPRPSGSRFKKGSSINKAAQVPHQAQLPPLSKLSQPGSLDVSSPRKHSSPKKPPQATIEVPKKSSLQSQKQESHLAAAIGNIPKLALQPQAEFKISRASARSAGDISTCLDSSRQIDKTQRSQRTTPSDAAQNGAETLSEEPLKTGRDGRTGQKDCFLSERELRAMELNQWKVLNHLLQNAFAKHNARRDAELQAAVSQAIQQIAQKAEAESNARQQQDRAQAGAVLLAQSERMRSHMEIEADLATSMSNISEAVSKVMQLVPLGDHVTCGPDPQAADRNLLVQSLAGFSAGLDPLEEFLQYAKEAEPQVVAGDLQRLAHTDAELRSITLDNTVALKNLQDDLLLLESLNASASMCGQGFGNSLWT